MKISAQNVWNSFRRDEKIALICCALSLSFLAGFARQPQQSQKPFFQNITLNPLPPIQVHVTGLVKRPGVYQLKQKARVNDAIYLAGGVLPKAAIHSINLAAPLRDGQKIEVPAVESQRQQSGIATTLKAPSATQTAQATVINVNTATAAELESLPQIGPAIASRIIAHRQLHGAFGSLDDLDEVKGIGPKTLEKLEGKVSF